MKKKRKLQEKKQAVPKFLKCKLEKTEDGVKLIGFYEIEKEIEKEIEGKKQVVKEKEIVERIEEEVTASELDERIRRKLEVYGMYVKIQRVNAGVKNEQKRLENWKAVIDQLRKGEWERKTDNKKVIEKAKLDLINSIADPELKEKLKKELGLA